jgi:hypothetical protein
MQIRVAAAPPAAPYNLTTLRAVWARTATKRGVFEVSQDPIIVPEARYNSAYNAAFKVDPYVRIWQNTHTFETISGAATHTTVTYPLEPKALQDEMGEAFDKEYGRMSGMLGLMKPNSVAGQAGFMLYGYIAPPVDIIIDNITPAEPTPGDGTQIWKITHNVRHSHNHFHLFNVQLINRVA